MERSYAAVVALLPGECPTCGFSKWWGLPPGEHAEWCWTGNPTKPNLNYVRHRGGECQSHRVPPTRRCSPCWRWQHQQA